MERYLRPERLETDPNSSDAAKSWSHWLRTFENFVGSLQLNLEGLDKLATLFNFIGPSIYEYIAECTSYETAIDTLKSIYVKPKNEIFARHVLSTSKQEPGQPLDQFLQRLKMLSKDCNFKLVSADQCRDEAIRDAFISGLQSNAIRQRLLESTTLTLQAAFDTARSLEMAERQSQSYQYQPVTAPSHTASTAPSRNDVETDEYEATVAALGNQRCYFCGNRRHPRSKCPAREATCNQCGKKGHFQKVCRSVRIRDKQLSSTNAVFAVTSAAAGPESLKGAMIKLTINGKRLTALVDSGSSESYINATVPKNQKWKIIPSKTLISMASVTLRNQTQGHCNVKLVYQGRQYDNVKLSLLPNACSDVILGHDFLNRHSELKMPLLGEDPPFKVCGMTAANVETPSLFANLSPDCKPIATKSRRHPVADEQFIATEVKELLKSDIIEPSSSPWRAQVLVTTNERHKKRMVIDYSQTINKYTYLDAYPQKRVDDLVEKVSQYKHFSTLDLQSAYHQIPLKENEKPFTAFEAAGNLYQFKRIPFGVTNGVSSFQRVIDNIITKEDLSDTFAYVDNITICGHSKEAHDENLKRFLDTAEKYGITFNDSKSVIGVQEVDMLGYRLSHGVIRPDPERLRPLKEMQPPATLKAQQRIVGMFAYYSQWISHFSDKILPLTQNKVFPLPQDVCESFETLKNELENAILVSVNPKVPLVVETDASDVAISATLNQDGRPIAFFSRTLSSSEKNHSAVEKEAYAIIGAIRKWKHYLLNTHFKILTDQKSVSFIYDGSQRSKVKNDKIQRWKIELSPFDYEVIYRPGSENYAADALSRCGAIVGSSEELKILHEGLCHPGITRMAHFVRSKNLPYSVEEIKVMTSRCSVCAELKPRYYKPNYESLIKATQAFERLSMDFKGPLPSLSRNKYLLTIVDEFSRFPFAFACQDMSASTIVHCLTQLFTMCGTPSYIHSDRGASFMSNEVKTFLHERGVATSRTTPYNPQGNGQVERLNGTLWKAITLALKSRRLDVNRWEEVLMDALHSIRSLLCTETNATPHERLFQHQRRSTKGNSLPTWLLSQGPVYLKRHVRSSKYDPAVDEVELIEANPKYAHIRHRDGRESTVSLRHLAPFGELECNPQFRTFQNEEFANTPSPSINNPTENTETGRPNNIHHAPAPLSIAEDESGCMMPESEGITHPESSQGTVARLPESSEPKLLERTKRTPYIRTNPYNLRSGQK